MKSRFSDAPYDCLIFLKPVGSQPNLKMNSLSPLRSIFIVITCVVLGWPCVSAAQVYKVVGPDGKVTYSDKPPEGKNAPNTSTLSGVAGGASDANAAPKLRHGLWEFQRTFVIKGVPKDIKTQNCTDPISTMSFWQKTMTKVGCTYEDTRRSGNRYTQASACKLDGIAMDRQYTKVLEVSGQESYVLTESASGGSQPPMSSVTRARRLGDC